MWTLQPGIMVRSVTINRNIEINYKRQCSLFWRLNLDLTQKYSNHSCHFVALVPLFILPTKIHTKYTPSSLITRFWLHLIFLWWVGIANYRLCYTRLGHPKSGVIKFTWFVQKLRRYRWLMGWFCLVIELHRGGSATNRATLFSFFTWTELTSMGWDRSSFTE